MVMTTPKTTRDTRSSTMVNPRVRTGPESLGLMSHDTPIATVREMGSSRPGPSTVTVIRV